MSVFPRARRSSYLVFRTTTPDSIGSTMGTMTIGPNNVRHLMPGRLDQGRGRPASRMPRGKGPEPQPPSPAWIPGGLSSPAPKPPPMTRRGNDLTVAPYAITRAYQHKSPPELYLIGGALLGRAWVSRTPRGDTLPLTRPLSHRGINSAAAKPNPWPPRPSRRKRGRRGERRKGKGGRGGGHNEGRGVV